jgi:flagellar hook-basal body complex protein FliE
MLMRVGGTVLGRVLQPAPGEVERLNQMRASPPQASFGQALQQATRELNELQNEADAEAEAVATGRSGDIHKAIVAMRQAELSLELTAQVLQRAIEAYKEISRMQI